LYYQRFEDLPVWNDAIDSVTGKLNGVGDLKSQIERATISVSNNIAEGFERGTNNELIRFLYIARGSAGEVRSMLHLIERFPGMEDLGPDIHHLRGGVESISRQLGGWIEKLKDSDHRGARSQNKQARERAQKAKRQTECRDKLKAMVDETAWKKASPGDGKTNPGEIRE
jgi:four helix bundle protein